VYKVFTNKRKLLAAVVEAAMSGDVDAPVAQQPWWREQITEPSAARQLRLIARNARQIYDRAGLLLELLRGAATADPEVQAVVRRLEEERHRRGRLSARALVDKRALRPGMTAAEAARTLWILTAPELYLRQVRELGLTADAFRAVAGVIAATRALARLTERVQEVHAFGHTAQRQVGGTFRKHDCWRLPWLRSSRLHQRVAVHQLIIAERQVSRLNLRGREVRCRGPSGPVCTGWEFAKGGVTWQQH
jgi:hypothetical protein